MLEAQNIAPAKLLHIREERKDILMDVKCVWRALCWFPRGVWCGLRKMTTEQVFQELQMVNVMAFYCQKNVRAYHMFCCAFMDNEASVRHRNGASVCECMCNVQKRFELCANKKFSGAQAMPQLSPGEWHLYFHNMFLKACVPEKLITALGNYNAEFVWPTLISL